MPDWLLRESYPAVGDFAETIALLLPPADASDALPLQVWIETAAAPARGRRGDAAAPIGEAWRELDEGQRFACNKLITGEFRVGVSQTLVVRAIAEPAASLPRRWRTA